MSNSILVDYKRNTLIARYTHKGKTCDPKDLIDLIGSVKELPNRIAVYFPYNVTECTANCDAGGSGDNKAQKRESCRHSTKYKGKYICRDFDQQWDDRNGHTNTEESDTFTPPYCLTIVKGQIERKGSEITKKHIEIVMKKLKLN